MARLVRLELTTSAFAGLRSIQLSYKRTVVCYGVCSVCKQLFYKIWDTATSLKFAAVLWFGWVKVAGLLLVHLALQHLLMLVNDGM